MATVYGIIKQNNGFINVASEPGIGSCVTIYLPLHAETTPLKLVTHEEPALAKKSTRTIMLVEDEPENLEMYRTMIENQGYTVLTASNPRECLDLCRSYTGDIDLLITDVVMPDMNGRELADAVTSVRPTTRCLFMSGYSAEVITRNGVLVNGINFIEKPFTLQNFAAKIKEVLSSTDAQHNSNLKVLKSKDLDPR
jgi:response regulator RpfG family c-di-GMP phosphodiesterase